MLAVKTGFLLLAGPDDSRASESAGWALAWWDGKPAANGGVVQPRWLAALDLKDVKLPRGVNAVTRGSQNNPALVSVVAPLVIIEAAVAAPAADAKGKGKGKGKK